MSEWSPRADAQQDPAAAGPVDAGEERERVNRILRERARNLARKLKEAELEKTSDVVVMELGGNRYAIDADLVREVFAIRDVTSLPASPDFVIGITNVRGKIIAVLDLLLILERGSSSRAISQVIIVDVNGVEVAFDVGESGVAQIPQSHFQAPPPTGARYLKAVTTDGIAVLDVEKIIAETRQTAASLASGDGR